MHIALEVDPATLEELLEKGKSAGIETRGVADHGFIRSIYFRDPNGYLIELAAKTDATAAYRADAVKNATVRWPRGRTPNPQADKLLSITGAAIIRRS